jgi:hypothetical protein
MSKPVRQITPPLSRIWLFGILATVVTGALNYSWWWICQNVFSWELQVPQAFNSSVLVPLSDVRIFIATGVAGLLATFGAHLLGKTVIGPRIWWLIISTAAGLASLYGVLTYSTLALSLRIGLAVMHVIAIVVIIPLLTKALTIGDDDVEKVVQKHSAYKQAKIAEAPVVEPAPTFENEVSTINPTVVIPQFDLATVLDRTEDDAQATIAAAGFEARIISRDGQMFATARDFREDRVNLEVTNGVVSNAHIG